MIPDCRHNNKQNAFAYIELSFMNENLLGDHIILLLFGLWKLETEMLMLTREQLKSIRLVLLLG